MGMGMLHEDVRRHVFGDVATWQRARGQGVVRHAVLGPAGRLAEILLVSIANNVASFHSFLGAIK